ncbi:MAG TPA: uracil-DNA glycosylase [Methylomirabilota bacterium]|nr:uracil-DNA glycosylase [Methylomirabilota bacterium]
MFVPFNQLLDVTIEHFRLLKARGTQFVAVEPETMRVLNAPARRSNSPSRTANSEHRTETAVPVANGAPALDSHLPTPDSSKAQAIAELRDRAMQCMKCAHLASTRKNVVFGVGNIDAAIMFVGEAPGADEDLQGEPFVGAAGQLLTRMIGAMGLSRDHVYIANILKCRPDMPAGSSGNRKPTPEEMQTCIPYLHAQIDLIGPKVLIALGGTAMEGLLGKSGITKLRGQWHTYRGIPLMPTYHPAYLLRNQSNAEKRKVWEDLMAVMEKAGLSITEKQRGFFLKS